MIPSAGFHCGTGRWATHTHARIAAMHKPQIIPTACSCFSQGKCNEVLGTCPS